MSQEIQTAADKLRGQIAEKVATIKGDPQMIEVIQLLAALNGLEPLLQQPKTTLSSFFALNGEAASAGSTTVAAAEGRRPVITRDEFVHVPALEAAKRYLRKAERPARSLDEI